MTAVRGLLAAAATTLIAGCVGPESTANTTAQESMSTGLLDYEITVSHDAVMPGALRIEVTNAGRDSHDLAAAADEERATTPRLRPGEDAVLVLDVPADSEELVLWCTLPGHRAQGMQASVLVARDDTTEQ